MIPYPPAQESSSATARAVAVTDHLRRAYPDRRPLLRYRSPFELLIGVILSAQTTDEQVNRATPALFARFPTPAALAAADPAEVERLVHATGFYRAKTRSIIGAARAVQERFGGGVPEAMEDLVSIPGVGRKSANVIRGVVYRVPSIVVDTHLTRVAGRLGLADGRNPVAIERTLGGILPESDWTDFSMGVNLHGRRVCTARAPGCGDCILADLCPWPADGRPGATAVTRG